MTDVLVVLVTVGNKDEAELVAQTLVREKLAACINIIPQIRSVYWWQGEVCEDPELLLVVKTTESVFPALRDRIRELHSYDVPEIIALSVSKGLSDYLKWVSESTGVQK